ncbi:MAG: 2-C-methyl-D-erythritol 2,4-cyclodiphosphate synthase [Candidatus Desulfofervidaceae bacterium]|nr:2-C-methyl-D-erythritol 2,4-cyclodiphosphate synthase [Candidatus Desulfofervidaceae bacterium]MDL1970790.1 2-C-methyl-D-erythritol 2,4-cyclodiphosphate synthase [Candidatus Desulfofervidaceae bacterium]
MARVGFGFDVHRLVKGRPLILGGIEVPFAKGLLGHSDGDVLLHAIIDALLGAMGEGDIGQHFPDTDPAWKGISSLRLLFGVKKIMDEKHFTLINLDATVVAQAPKLVSYFPKMKMKIAATLDVDAALINLKAKTTEGLGYIGKEEGIAAYAVALLEGVQEN